eukprot:813981-Rhodomonas_salina.1
MEGGMLVHSGLSSLLCACYAVPASACTAMRCSVLVLVPRCATERKRKNSTETARCRVMPDTGITRGTERGAAASCAVCCYAMLRPRGLAQRLVV